MTKLNDYIDNMFVSLPDNEEVRAAKQTISENMTDKYEGLLAEGKNEAEAFGTTVSEFGSIRELGKEMGWDFWEPKSSPNTESTTTVQEPSGKGAAGGTYTGSSVAESVEHAAASVVEAAKETGSTFSEWWNSQDKKARNKVINALITRGIIILILISVVGGAFGSRDGVLFLFAIVAAVALTFYPKSPLYIDFKSAKEGSEKDEPKDSTPNKG